MHCTIPEDDVYSLLGIPVQATHSEITRAYRKLAMAWHPDRNDEGGAEEQFKRIRLAYETLRDPSRRAEYDRQRRQGGRRNMQRPAPSARAEAEAREAAAEPAPRARDLSRKVSISLAEQVFGCRPKIKVTRTEYCSSCDGFGQLAQHSDTCMRCRGTGRIRKGSLAFFIFRAEEMECEDCGGLGKLRPRCPACEGSGTGATRSGHLQFEVSPGQRPDSIKRVRGFGRPGRKGEAPGDLMVKISYSRHPLFEVAFPDLRCEMPVSAFRVLAGGTVTLPTLGGLVELPLPPDAVDGSELHIAGEGLLDAATGRRGALHVKLRVLRPTSLNAKQKALLDELERSLGSQGGRADPFADWAKRVDDARRQQSRSPRRES